MMFSTPLYKAFGRFMLLFAVVFTFAACQPTVTVPTDATATNEAAKIYPDYRDITIPPNIAPLNFKVMQAGSEYVAHIEGKSRQIVAAAGSDGVVQIDSLEWKQLLSDKAQQLTVTLYAKRDEGWVQFPSYSINVAAEAIDPYLSYRLIEPSYELYRQMGLYQRHLEGFDVRTIYENNRTYTDHENHCVNCHNYQNYSTRRMLFHVRAAHAGTVFIKDGKAEKRTIKSDSLIAGATYPSWHPTRNWVLFSTNQTGQTFHIRNKQKVEVVDYGSDLFLYDVDKDEVKPITHTTGTLETFPCWAPTGDKVYFTSAHVPLFENVPDSVRSNAVTQIYSTIRYNVMSMTFDAATGKFGAPQTEVDCATMGRSASVARISPDGRYLLFTLAPYGQFHIWHTEADLWVKDMSTGRVYPLSQTNSPQADSYHTWSSNGRWIVFSSRRDDGSFTRPYIAYFDKAGQGHKAFLLPQLNPMQNVELPKSYNVPELTRDAAPCLKALPKD